MGVGGVDGGQAILDAGLAAQLVLPVVTIGIGGAVRGSAFAVETRGEGARRVVPGGGGRVDSAAEGYGRGADGDAILAVIDAAAVGKNVDISAFRTELAIALRRRLEWQRWKTEDMGD